MLRCARNGMLGAVVGLFLGACSASSVSPVLDRRAPDAGEQPDASVVLPSDAGADAGADAGLTDAGTACVQGQSDAILACLREGVSPDDCADRAGGHLCDSDGDGVGDDLEAAMSVEYSPVFAFNGGQYGGNAETNWPANVNHFATHAALYFRPSDGGSDLLVDPAPTLSALPTETYDGGDALHVAADPSFGNGSEFYLCLTDTTGSTGVRVESEAAMLALPDGVDVASIVQPANGSLALSTHVMIAYDLFFAYNQFASGLDDHEGDWEGVIVFVNRMTGAVDSAFYGRHDSTDNTFFIDNATYPPRDASAPEPSRGTDVSSSDPSLHGIRFQDFNGLRHHLVAFVATGSHAMYDYPANTFVINNVVRDTHDGDGPWLDIAAEQMLAPDGGTTAVRIVRRNPGQLGSFLLPWAGYRGQWGCQNGSIAQSWPGPWGNARHPRPELERAWGSPPTAWP